MSESRQEIAECPFKIPVAASIMPLRMALGQALEHIDSLGVR